MRAAIVLLLLWATFIDMRYIPVWPQDKQLTHTTRRSSDPVRFVLIAGIVGALVLSSSYFFVDALSRRSLAQVASNDFNGSIHPVLSARRTPVTLSTTSRLGNVRRALATVSNRLPTGACMRVDWLGTTLASVRSDVTLIPASASKLTTAAAALEVLGPEYTFETEIFSDPLSANGTTSNIYVMGGGDPLLVTNSYVATEKYPTLSGTSLDELVRRISTFGIKQITQSIVIIDSRYDQERFIDEWPSSFYGVEAGPLGALMFNDVVVTGQAIKPDDPGIAAGTELGILLAQRGVVVNTNVQRVSQVPTGAVKIASISSAPLTAIVQEMLVNSDNNTAELLIKELGFVKKGTGTTAAGLEVISELVKTWGNGVISVVDGSGLSSSNLSTCDFYVDVLNRNKETFPSLLAVAGRTGTLNTSFNDSPVRGRLVAKTGTLTGVKALVGYLPLDDEEDVQFSLLINASNADSQSNYGPIWISFAEALNRARAVPRPDQLSP